jgi:hypothetical protein
MWGKRTNCFILFILFFSVYTVLFVYTVFFCVHKKTKKNKRTFVLFCFFWCTQILGLTISHCARKHCLCHVLDSPFRTLASYFSYCTKTESCENLFVRSHSLPKNPFLLRKRDFSRMRFVASQRRLQENVFTRANLLGGGQSYCFPPFNPPNPVSSCRNSFFVFVSDRSKSGFAENRITIRFLDIRSGTMNL